MASRLCACVIPMARYVPPYDAGERHLPGYNFCGPGTDVARRRREGVEPMNELDAACLMHDLETEPRGPYRSGGDPAKVLEADIELEKQARAIADRTEGPERLAALGVAVAMQMNRLRVSRGGPLLP